MKDSIVSSRELVYRVLDSERDYQDKLGPERTNNEVKSVGDYLSLMQHSLNLAFKEYYQHPGNIQALQQVRKITALGVRCMEEKGAFFRG